jgi:heat-inducible transcriptional repressor
VIKLTKNRDLIELSDRKRQLLLGAVESYIENALPITSEKVQSNLFTSLSSATLRNELSTLEELGFLKQLHTSSGRVPTTKAYRYFVNNLMESKKFDKSLLDKVKDKFENRNMFLLDTIDGIAKRIGEIVEYPVFVSMSGYEMLEIKAINVIPLITGQALLLIQTTDGIINNTINLSKEVTEEHCKDASKFLTTNLMNKRLIDVINNFDYYNDKFKSQIKYFNNFFSEVINVLNDYIERGTSKVVKGNTSELLEKTHIDDLSKAKKFLNLVENGKEIQRAICKIDENKEDDIYFSIGDENESEDMADYSIIKANYKLPSGITAHFGVVGPERMDYAKIASALKFIVDEMNNMEGENKDE